MPWAPRCRLRPPQRFAMRRWTKLRPRLGARKATKNLEIHRRQVSLAVPPIEAVRWLSGPIGSPPHSLQKLVQGNIDADRSD